MSMQPIEEIYSQRRMASHIAAERIATALRRRLADADEASLVASGGTTPERCLDVLGQLPLDWGRVRVTLSDERWVPADDDASNERLLRRTLLRGPASAASFLPLYADDTTPEDHCVALDPLLRELPCPPACALLGMGEDGHFASLFPDSDATGAALDADSPSLCVPVRTAASPHARISLTLAALADSDEIILLIFGEEKRRVYEAALDGDGNYPVSALLQRANTRIRVIWAP